MATVTLEKPLLSVFSEETAQTTLTNHFTNQELTPLLLAFCSNDLYESEHQMLLNNSNLVVCTLIDLIWDR
jgi:hypothetical protein